MSTIPEDRPLSADEYALTRWLLAHGLPGADAHPGALDRARVVGRCGCGCAREEQVSRATRTGTNWHILTSRSVIIKVGMVGDSQIGKTSLMVKYVEGSFDEDYIQTLGESSVLLVYLLSVDRGGPWLC